MNNNDGNISQCPFMGGTQKQTAGGGTSVRDFWPNELKLNILRQTEKHQTQWLKILIMQLLLIALIMQN